MPQYGMNLDPNNHIGAGGVPDNPEKLKGLKWVRLVFNAEPMELRPLNIDQLCQHYAHQIVDAYNNSGIHTLFVLNHQISVDFRPGAGGVIDQNYIDKFAEKCGQIAQRLKGKGVAYEIWNEEDQASGSATGITKESFKPLLGAACAQIKSADPNARRIFGGLVSGDPIAYAKACLDDQGKLPVHAIGVHPYTKFTNTTGLSSALKTISGSFSGMHIWLTEFEDGGIKTDDQDQAAANNMRLFANALPSVVDVAIWYCWSDGMNDGFGVVRESGEQKAKIYPAFFAAAGAAPPIVIPTPHEDGGVPIIVQPAADFTNQNLIDAFFKAANATNADVWKLMADAGVGFLASIKKADRQNPYTGTPISDLPNLTPQQRDIIQQALPQPARAPVPDTPAPPALAPAPAPSAVSEFKLNIQWVSQMDKRGHGNNDCGDASVFMLLEYYDLAVPSREEVFNVLQGKTTAKQLIGLAKNYGLSLTNVPASVEGLTALLNADKPIIFPVEYKSLKFPLHLATPDQGGLGDDQGAHWFVVVGYDDKGFFVHDPLWMPTQRNGQGGAFLHIDTEVLKTAMLPFTMIYKAD